MMTERLLLAMAIGLGFCCIDQCQASSCTEAGGIRVPLLQLFKKDSSGNYVEVQKVPTASSELMVKLKFDFAPKLHGPQQYDLVMTVVASGTIVLMGWLKISDTKTIECPPELCNMEGVSCPVMATKIGGEHAPMMLCHGDTLISGISPISAPKVHMHDVSLPVMNDLKITLKVDVTWNGGGHACYSRVFDVDV